MDPEEIEIKEGDLSANLDAVDLDDNNENSEEEDEGGEEFYDNSHMLVSIHEGPVFVVSIDPKFGKYVVSGGEDDIGFVWDIETGDILIECTGHKDSVTCAGFSADSAYVATGDMSGLIKVWNMESKQEVCQFETSDLEWLQWHPVATILMAGAQDGNAWLWKVPSGESKFFSSPGCACTCGRILADGKTAALGYNDGSLRLYNLKTEKCLQALTKGRDLHRGPVNQLECDKNGQFVFTGSIDGTAKILNPATWKVSFTHKCDKANEGDNSVENVAFSQRFQLLAIASLNNVVYLFDVRSSQTRHKFQHPDGVVRVCWNSDETKLVSACLDGIARIWDARSGSLLGTCVGHTDQVVDFALSKDDKWLTTASMDGSVRVYSFSNLIESDNQ